MALDELITLSYGSGGKKTSELIEELIVPELSNAALEALADGAILKATDKIVFSTDSFVINPYFFAGGDIGKLSVCGTVNDLCMSGGEPKYLSLSLIIEEGFKTEDLKQIIKSIKDTAQFCNVDIVTGDTKVVEKGHGDGIYINTAGIGFAKCLTYGEHNIKPGDAVIVSGTVGDHGASVMAIRNKLVLTGNLKSDCMPLHRLAGRMFEFEDRVRIMRDPTRGGLATTLNEFIEHTNLSIEIDEERVPISNEVSNVCEILGLDPLYSANEGKLVAIVDKSLADTIVDALKSYDEGKNASIIGYVTDRYPKRVVLKTYLGGSRILSKLTSAQLPRIC